jgi:hypothetical protein
MKGFVWFESVTEKWLRKREMRNSKCEWNEVFVFCAAGWLRCEASVKWKKRWMLIVLNYPSVSLLIT